MDHRWRTDCFLQSLFGKHSAPEPLQIIGDSLRENRCRINMFCLNEENFLAGAFFPKNRQVSDSNSVEIHQAL